MDKNIDSKKFNKEENKINYLLNIIKGIIIGAGAIAPGISGSTLAIILGVYKKFINILANIPKSFVKNFSFLATLGIGVLIGILGIAKSIDYIIKQGREIPLYFCFLGLMIGTIPFQFKESIKSNFKKHDVIPFFILFAISFFIGMKSNVAVAKTNLPAFHILILVGLIYGLSLILPGISSTAILTSFGIYAVINNAIADIKISALLPIGLGMILTVLIFSKLINYLFINHYNKINFAILGLLIGAIPALFPGFSTSMMENIFSTFIFIISMFITLYLSKIESKKIA